MKIRIGDLFEIKTSKGMGYFQYVYNNKTLGELIRVFPGLHKERPNDFDYIINSRNYYFVHFPLKAALKRDIVRFIDNYNIPPTVDLPKKMRSKKVDKNGHLISWQIIDYETWKRYNKNDLSEEERNLSPWGTWNDTLLIERLEKGWTPKDWE